MYMEKEINTIDGLEVFVKVKMGVDLTDDELAIYNSYDDAEKKMVFDFINNSAFTDDLNKLTKKIQNHIDNNNIIKK